jgi:hypothetical protein
MATGFKSGGRTKGTPNKKTTDIQQLLENLNCNPIEGMARIAENVEINISTRLIAYKELAQYAFPKRRSVDLNTSLNVLSHEDALAYLESQ